MMMNFTFNEEDKESEEDSDGELLINLYRKELNRLKLSRLDCTCELPQDLDSDSDDLYN